MPYVTLQQMTDRSGLDLLVALTDRAEVPTGAVDNAVFGRAVAGADALIDGYLAGRYVLPFAAIPALIVEIAAAITLWNLHITEPPPKVKADYDAALKQLSDIAKGTIRIPGAAGVEPATTGAGGVIVTDRERPFTAENMTGFI